MPETYPVTSFRFEVIARDFEASFSKVSGLREEIEVVEMRDGTDPFQVRKIPGMRGGGEVTFSKGITSTSDKLYKWFRHTKKLSTEFRRDMIVDIRGCEGSRVFDPEKHATSQRPSYENNPVAKTILLQATWPRAFEVGDLDAQASEVALHTLGVVFEDMILV
jgi:phage tail-like protein